MYVSPAEYHTWAQQSLNRVSDIKIKIKVNGVSHESYDDYKVAVKRFQKKVIGRVNGLVDETTQNYLIQNNHVDFRYSKWIRESLYKITGDTSLIHMSGHDANLIAAIKKYQGSKKKANLVVDGWVGVRTELVLALEGAIRIPDPDPTGPPIIPGAQGVTIWLDRLEDDLEFAKLPVILPYKMDTNVDDKTIFRKFITKMQLETLDDEYFDWRTAKDYPQSGQGG
jgi:hypothetical protein